MWIYKILMYFNIAFLWDWLTPSWMHFLILIHFPFSLGLVIFASKCFLHHMQKWKISIEYRHIKSPLSPRKTTWEEQCFTISRECVFLHIVCVFLVLHSHFPTYRNFAIPCVPQHLECFWSFGRGRKNVLWFPTNMMFPHSTQGSGSMHYLATFHSRLDVATLCQKYHASFLHEIWNSFHINSYYLI